MADTFSNFRLDKSPVPGHCGNSTLYSGA